MRTILHVFSTFAVGGPQVRFAVLANHFGQRYRHRIIAMDGVTDTFVKLHSGLDASLVTLSNRRGRLWSDVRLFRGVLRELQPDLLVTSNWGAIEWTFANLTAGIPHLHMEDGFGPDEANRQIARRVWTRRLALRRSIVLLPSQTLFQIARDIWRLPQRCLTYVPNGIGCQRFLAQRDRKLMTDFGIDTRLPVIGTVTRLRPEKNIRRLIDAFALVLNEVPAQLVIVGDGPERSALLAQAAALGISDRVLFTGQVSSPEKLLSSFDVFALSSDTEQMPLSVLEAMAAARPLAATEVGDVRYMIAEENHPFLARPDVNCLARAILMLLADPARAADAGAANARRAAELFDESQMFAKYQALFDGERHI